MKDIDQIRRELEEPFSAMDIRFRLQSTPKDLRASFPKPKVVPYIESRAIHRRLSDVVGFGNWSMTYKGLDMKDVVHDSHWRNPKSGSTEMRNYETVYGGVICTISIYLDGQWIAREGGSGLTQTEPYKGCLSQSEKRAAVPWGIGAYLYEMDMIEVDHTVNKPQQLYGWKREYNRSAKLGWYWKIPDLPYWCMPKTENKDVFDRLTSKINDHLEGCDTNKFRQEVANSYPPEYSIKTIIASRGKEILERLERKGFECQKEKESH